MTLLVVMTSRLAAEEPPRLTHGIAVGEVRDTSAVIWARCARAATLHVVMGSRPAAATRVTAERDFTGRIAVDGLEPATPYRYRAWCEADERSDDSHAEHGTFRTAPARGDPRAVRFAWGGDLGGQNVCRDASRGYPVFDAVAARRPDFFIGLGDMIYADDACGGAGRYGNPQLPGVAPAPTLEAYWGHWRYNRDDPALRRLLAGTAYYAVWDDHEVVDDFGPSHDARSNPPWRPAQHLMPLGRAAFLDYARCAPTRRTGSTVRSAGDVIWSS